MTDILLVSLASTAGLRASDAALAGALERAGASVAVAATPPRRDVRTLALTDYVWAQSARTAATRALEQHRPRAVVYGAMGAALLWPRPGAIRLDAPMAANRPGRHGLWQRPLERRRVQEAPLLIPVSARTLEDVPSPHADAVVVPIPVSASGPIAGPRDIAAITYAANPHKKGLDRVLEAWARVRRDGEELWIAGTDAQAPVEGVRWAGRLAPDAYRALLRRARVFVTAPRQEDYGIAQLEALADGCRLVTTPASGPYEALALARELDPRLVSDDLATALRTGLDDRHPAYVVQAATLLERYRPAAVDHLVAEALLPRLLAG